MAKEGFFRGLGSAKPSVGGVYFQCNKGPDHTEKEPDWLPAMYVVEVKKLTAMVSRKKDDLFIFEAKILESDCPARKEGMTCSWVVNLAKDSALGNIRGCLAALSGIEPSDELGLEEIDDDVAELAVSDDQPFRGAMVGLECTMVKTKKNDDFTLHRWIPLGKGEMTFAEEAE